MEPTYRERRQEQGVKKPHGTTPGSVLLLPQVLNLQLRTAEVPPNDLALLQFPRTSLEPAPLLLEGEVSRAFS